MLIRRLSYVVLISLLLGISAKYMGERYIEPNYPESKHKLEVNADIAKNYDLFREYCEQYIHADDIVSLGISHPSSDEFQVLFQNPEFYLPMVKQVMADQDITPAVKLGVAATMLGLQIDELVEFVSYLNQLAKEDAKQFVNIEFVAHNIYQASYKIQEYRPNFAYYALSDYRKRASVRKLFRDIYNNPNLSQEEKEARYEGSYYYYAYE